MLNKDSKIYIAGHNGMVGSSIWRLLSSEGYFNLIGLPSKDLDLRNQSLVDEYISRERPNIIIDAAAKVGGILANNNNPYEFLMDNLLIQNNLIYSSHKYNIDKFIFLGSSCIYPKFAKQPLREKYLLTDSLEKTNQWYALAKISGVKLIEALNKQYNRKYVSLMPTNLYGPHDNFDLETSHVLPAMINKFHLAKVEKRKSVKLWGSGTPMREFLHVDDLSRAILFILKNELNHNLYNIGSNCEVEISRLAEITSNIVGFGGKIIWDRTKPDGTPRKILDTSRMNDMGWHSKINLKFGIESTYKWFLKNYEQIKVKS